MTHLPQPLRYFEKTLQQLDAGCSDVEFDRRMKRLYDHLATGGKRWPVADLGITRVKIGGKLKTYRRSIILNSTCELAIQTVRFNDFTEFEFVRFDAEGVQTLDRYTLARPPP